MRKIYLLHSNYNWDSYSQVRSIVEILREREDVELLNEWRDEGEIWVYDSRLEITEALRDGVRVVVFGLSDPNMFFEGRLKHCDLYCTNDLRTHKEHPGSYYFPVGVDLKYFKPMDVEKDMEVLFIGTRIHSYIPCRKNYIEKLIKDDLVDFRGYGKGFHHFVSGERLVEAYNRALLNIDICTKYSSLASRIFQAAACGTPTLTLKRDDVCELFEDGKEILTYEGGYDELRFAIFRALRDKDKLMKIGQAARERAVKDHGMRKRVDDLITYLGENDEVS